MLSADTSPSWLLSSFRSKKNFSSLLRKFGLLVPSEINSLKEFEHGGALLGVCFFILSLKDISDIPVVE